MAKKLLIVESPSKAKTIKKYLGKDYDVASSYGHIADLPEDRMGVDLKSFEPQYIIPKDKKKVVNQLKQLAGKAEQVLLASDEDREGEAIAWHLKNFLKLDDKAKRIVFHEITKKAITEAVRSPRDINQNLVNAQQARRVLDRLVGYKLSPVLWKKVKRGLSAGRVQSVAVRLIVEREKEIRSFKSKYAFRVSGEFTKDSGEKIQAGLEKEFKTDQEVKDYFEKIKDADFAVGSIEKKPGKKTPPPPFTTSTLQQEASRLYGFSVSKTMQIAQFLYENGLITYMRTDSVHLSDEALTKAKQTIIAKFGKEYSRPFQYKTKSKNAQEAHEAIRPTSFDNEAPALDRDALKLYQLIWKRTLASQMKPAELEFTTVNIANDKDKALFKAKGKVILFDGFMKLYKTEDTDEEQQIFKVEKGEKLTPVQFTAMQKYSRPPVRYTEAALVRKLEELGIGRPSTYAPIISTIQRRGYVERKSVPAKTRSVLQIRLQDGKITEQKTKERYGAEKNKLLPTDMGFIVTDFLTEHFSDIMDYRFTANVEEEFDKVARGEKDWHEPIRVFYEAFAPVVTKVEAESKRAKGERFLGTHPETGEKVYAKFGPYGPMIQMGESLQGKKPKYASLLPGMSLMDITLEQAVALLSLPKVIGQMDGEDMVLGIGKYGPYVRFRGKFYNVPKHVDVLRMTADDAQAIVQQKQQADKPLAEIDGHPVVMASGRYGRYLKWNNMNIPIPRNTDPASLTEEDIRELIKAKEEKDRKNTLRTFDGGFSVRKGGYGRLYAYGPDGKRKMLPRDADPEKITLEQIQSLFK